MTLAGALGPVLGGLLTTELSWRWIFFVNLPLGAAAILVTLVAVQEFRPPHARGSTSRARRSSPSTCSPSCTG